MIIYSQEHLANKCLSNVDLNFNHNQIVGPRGRILRTLKLLTHQNQQFLQSLGFKLLRKQ